MKNKLLFSVFVYFIILVLLSLGFWQLYRLSWKLDLINQIENSLKIDPVELQNVEKKNYLRIKTSGQIDFEKQIYLYNLNETGKPGFEVINPIKVGNEDYLINRGWISFEQKNKPEINVVDQKNIIGTLMLQSKSSSFKPKNEVDKNYWFTLDREDILKFTGKNFSKYIIYLNGNYENPRPRVITAKISNNHKKYAITWFSMAISILLIYLYFRKKNY
ncbi:SURF1 family protein [Candidatus Pelagibacter communis]|uniref:SURF1 family protein n=1 Tax=Pelagibacter ubique TaxID=198252 RepID=UPI00094D3A36|nr:SURF1 family protein [Candidatus Pelagibacter ubique]